jgi:vancomycin resistance protein YoaR
MIIIAFSGVILALPWVIAKRTTFFGHSKLAGLSLDGLSKTKAVQELEPLVERLHNTPITLYYNQEYWTATPKSLGAIVDYKAPLQRLWLIGRSGSPFKRWWEILFPPSLDLPLSVHIGSARLRTELFQLKPMIEKDPVNASFDIATGALIPEVWGRRLNVEATRPNLIKAIRSGNRRQAALVFLSVPPKTTAQQLRATRIQYLLSSYATHFDPNVHVRSANIRRGAQQISGILLPPDKVFSFNQTTGPRTTANGYGEALEIVNKRLVPGVGGGICQVSSTLYNAALLAGLPILERSSHSLPLGYVPLGRDATVYYGSLDLVFRNSTGGNILILTEVKEGRITVAILGETKPQNRYEIRTKILKKIPFTKEKTIDPQLPPGEQRLVQPGQKGYVVQSERLSHSENGEIKTEKLSIDHYRPQPEKVKVGPSPQKIKRSSRERLPWWEFILHPEPNDAEPPRTSESPPQPTH